MEKALAKRKLELSEKGTDAKNGDEHENLLEHLVKHTQGKEFSICLSFIYFMCVFFGML